MSGFRFRGFTRPTYTMVPDQIFDELLSHLREAELKALLYIIRRTFGFKKESDAISFSQFLKGITTKQGRVLDRGCGLNNRTSLSKALRSLEAKGIIETLKRRDEKGDKESTVYRLCFVDSEVGREVYYPSTRSAPPEVRETYLQETVEQETVEQETVISKLKPSSNLSISKEEEIEELISLELETLIETCSREFDDMEHLQSNLSRAFNLWAKTRFDEAEMLAYVRQARETTKQRISSSVVRNRQKKMAYFFAVLEDVLGLKQAKS